MKTGLVLEGGALRTIFSSGACDALLDRDLMPDYVVGVSAGIAYGVSYISRQKRRNLHILTNYANDKRYMGPKNLLEPDNRCYFGLKFTYETIPNELIPFDYETFAAYPGQVEAVVTNSCVTMEARAERYNDSRERLFRLEEEGKVLLIAPEDTQGFSRTEKDVGKIMKLWKDGYDHTLSRLDEIRAFWQG